MTVKCLERISTKDGSDEENYAEGLYWRIGQYQDLGNGFFWDGTDLWVDWDGDGVPDSIWLDPVDVEGDSNDDSNDDNNEPPTDPFAGQPGEGTGGGNEVYTPPAPEVIAEREAYNMGLVILDKIDKDVKVGNISCYSLGDLLQQSTIVAE